MAATLRAVAGWAADVSLFAERQASHGAASSRTPAFIVPSPKCQPLRFFKSVSSAIPHAAQASAVSPFFEMEHALPRDLDRSGAGSASEPPSAIADQLPELRQVLNLLKEKAAKAERSAGGVSGSGKGPGNVYLVGTGPGDPDLLTIKAVKLMQSADLVLYDRLVSTDILDMVHDGAKLVYVGKTAGFHSRTQDEIHELLLRFAEAGATVLRLKGGDPLVFGRGGEEMDFLEQQGIHVQIVPGITAASGISARLGIPLTHRGVANSVRFLTGHSRKGGEDPLFVAGSAADPDTTLVVYMGLATLPGLAAKLLANGLPADTPAVAVERGTTPEERVVFARLESLPSEVEKANLVSPTLLVIGGVVELSHLWPFENEMKGNKARAAGERLPIGPRDRSKRPAESAAAC